MDQQEHCGISARPAALWLQLRLAARDFHLRAGILPLEPVVLPAHAGARAGLPQEEPRELVSQVLHGAGQRAGGEWRLLLAARRYAGGIARNRAVVPEDDRVRGPIAGRLEGTREQMARTRHPDAAELDREVAGREGEVCRGGRGGRRGNRSLYYTYSHNLRRNSRDPGAAA